MIYLQSGKAKVIAALLASILCSGHQFANAAIEIKGDVNITDWSGVFFTGYDGQSGFTHVENSQGASADDGFAYWNDLLDKDAAANVSWADGTAAGDPSTKTASASLDINLTGQPVGSSAEGIASGAFGGVTPSVGDFEVYFRIDALAHGPKVDGLFGIHVDAFESGIGTTADLTPLVTPSVYSDALGTSFDMSLEEKTPGSGDYAWFFAISAAEIALYGGEISDSYTASFSFAAPAATYVSAEMTAFALAEGAVVPEPTAIMIWSLLGALGVCVSRYRRRSTV